jgi:hypothetical protein
MRLNQYFATSVLLVLSLVFLRCRDKHPNPSGNNNTISNTTGQSNDLFDKVSTDTVSVDLLQKSTFRLNGDQSFFVALDENRIIATANWDRGEVYIKDGSGRKILDTIKVSKYSADLQQVPPDGDIFLQNNAGEVKILVPEPTDFSPSYAVSTIGKPALHSTPESTLKNLVVEDIGNAYFGGDFIFMNDSVYRVQEMNTLNIKKNGKVLYSVNFGPGMRQIELNHGKYNQELYYPNSIFPYRDKLFFLSRNIGNSTIVVYNLLNEQVKKFALPYSVVAIHPSSSGVYLEQEPVRKSEAVQFTEYAYLPIE